MQTAAHRKRRRPHTDLVVESDLPRIDGIMPWERELLVPIVEQLVDEALADNIPERQTPTTEHAEEQDQDR